ncbi:MAG: ABC-2 transporter permease [Lachnospiraceae bacterium]|nr:ABC-2 transporter permease [Lachnospiraceae bacterium]
MKGMLVKDMRLMLQQKRFFIIFFLISIWLHYIVGGIFVIAYLTFICSSFALSTISYDEFDNGFSFLMTLPVERRAYVRGKYIFGILVGGGAWIIGVLLSLGFLFIQGTSVAFGEYFQALMICIPIFLCFLAIMIPFLLKFGAEKGKLISIAVMMTVAVIGYFVVSWMERTGVDIDQLIRALESFWLGIGELIILVVSAAVTYISFLISCAIMKKKEF